MRIGFDLELAEDGQPFFSAVLYDGDRLVAGLSATTAKQMHALLVQARWPWVWPPWAHPTAPETP